MQALQLTVPLSTEYDPVTATVYTIEGQANVPVSFLNCCRLLAHHPTQEAS